MSDDFDEYWVYVFAKESADGLTSPVKVGISKDPNKRVESIQTACPFKIRMAYVFECPNKEWAAKLERCFHDTQASSRAHGEWFHFEPVIAIHLLCLAYRSLLDHHIKNRREIDLYLNKAGVLTAERRWHLATPTAVAQ